MNIEKADKKQIEEMAQIINGGTELDTVAYYHCMNIAKTIYNAGYRKLPEDSVVLSKEEYIDLSRNYVGEQVAQTRKETAEKIYKLVDSKLDLYRNCVIGGTLYDRGYQMAISDIKQKIKDIFGVEIKEL